VLGRHRDPRAAGVGGGIAGHGPARRVRGHVAPAGWPRPEAGRHRLRADGRHRGQELVTHPILADRHRLLVYVSAWEILGLLLAALLVLGGGFSWASALALAVPLSALYAFVCLGAFWVCRAAPLRLERLPEAAGAQLAAAALSATLWLMASRLWAASLERMGLFASLSEQQHRASPLLFGLGLLLFLPPSAPPYMLAALHDPRPAEPEA